MIHFWHPPFFILITLATVFCAATSVAADPEPPASPEVATAMQPYLDSYKMAGIIGIIADREGSDNNKEADIRETFIVGPGVFNITKEVKYEGKEKYFTRNQLQCRKK